MNLLIIIFMIVFVIYKDKKNREKNVAGMNKSAKERQKQMGRDVQRQREMQKRTEKKCQQEAFEAKRTRQQQQLKSTQSRLAETNRQRELKNRLERKYHSTVQQESILERAVGNVTEEGNQEKKSARMVKEQNIGADQGAVYVNSAVDEGGTMKKVYDLMITGYDGELRFKRDFVAEGMEMLDRCYYSETK